MAPLRFISSVLCVYREHVSTKSFIAWLSSPDFHRTCFTSRIRITKCAKFEPMLAYFVKFYTGKLVIGSDSMRVSN